MLSNLVLNSSRYTPRGGHIGLDVGVSGRELRIRAWDDGIGIPGDKLEEIFHPFTRLDNGVGEAGGGLGIGLTLARRIVTLHNGTIEARSEGPGRGSEFVIRLPVVVAVVHAREGPAAALRAPAERRRVLMVDDNDDVTESLAMLLRKLGHEAATAKDGIEGFRYAECGVFDLALLDIGMPRVNGYGLARRIRGEPWGRSIQLIALSGWGGRQGQDRGDRSGLRRPPHEAGGSRPAGRGSGQQDALAEIGSPPRPAGGMLIVR